MCHKTGVSVFKISDLIKVKMKMKNSLPRCDINRPRPRFGHKYTSNIKSVSER